MARWVWSDVGPFSEAERADALELAASVIEDHPWPHKDTAFDVLRYEATLQAVEAERNAAEVQVDLRDEVIATLTAEVERLRGGSTAPVDGREAGEALLDDDSLSW